MAHTRGEIAFVNGLSDSGDFWACVQSGTPGSWRRLTGYTSAGSLTVLSAPVRVYDSRTGQVPTAIGPKTPLANGVDREVAMTANLSGVPTDVTAVLVNLTVVNQNGTGWLSVRAKGTTYNGHSNLNFPVGGAVANMCLSRCADGQISVTSSVSLPGNIREARTDNNGLSTTTVPVTTTTEVPPPAAVSAPIEVSAHSSAEIDLGDIDFYQRALKRLKARGEVER